MAKIYNIDEHLPDPLHEDITVTDEDRALAKEYLDEGVKDLLSVLALAASLHFAPMANAADAINPTLPISELPAEVVNDFNLKMSNVTKQDAQHIADLVFTKLGDEMANGAANVKDTKSWKQAENIYKTLVPLNYKIATAFLGKFNVDSKKLWGIQMRALPEPVKQTAESTEPLPIRTGYMNEKMMTEHKLDFETWKNMVIDIMNDGMLDLTVMSAEDIAECKKLLDKYFEAKDLTPEQVAKIISDALKQFMIDHKSSFMTDEDVAFMDKMHKIFG